MKTNKINIRKMTPADIYLAENAIEREKQDELTSFAKQLGAGLVDRFIEVFTIVAITIAFACLLALIVVNIAK